MSKIKRNVISLPDDFCFVLDNLIDDKMICNRTDAMKHIILELRKHAPATVVFSVPTQQKNDQTISKLNNILREILGQDITQISEQSLKIWVEELKTNKSLAEKFVVMRKENIELKKRLAEQKPPTLDDLVDKGMV